jgi:hypothetical protein
VRQPKPPADDATVAEEGANILGASAGRDVEVFGLAAQQQVPDAASYEVRLKAASLEAPYDLGRIGVDPVFVEGHVVAHETGTVVPLPAAIRPTLAAIRSITSLVTSSAGPRAWLR